MEIVNDEKPRVILNEQHISLNTPSAPTIFDDVFDIKTFKKKFRIVIIRYEDWEMEFDLIGIHPFLANTFRRLLLSDVPSMAIEKVFVYNNTSIIQDEVLSHRLGLIPLRADPRQFEFRPEGAPLNALGFIGLGVPDFEYLNISGTTEGSERDTLEFELKIKCTWEKESQNSTRANDMYKNNNVYSEHIKWLPIGDQATMYKDSDVGPVHDDILIAKMRPGHELDLKLVAVKGIGRDHAKFSPVATAYYRLLPDIKLTREVEGEQAERLQKSFAPGVIGLKHTADGRKVAVVNNPRYDTNSRNVFRYDDLKDAVVMTKVRDHFIFTIESVGALKPNILFEEAIKALRTKCKLLLDELDHA